jgi:hypothetical protein
MMFSVGRLDLEDILIAPVVFFPFALVAALVLGVPTFLALSPLAPGRWWIALVAGAVLSVPLLLVLPGEPTSEMTLIFTPLSALSALVFWLVGRWIEEREGACCAC